MRVRKTEIMQIVTPALMKIVGEYRRRLATHGRAGRGFLANLESALMAAHPISIDDFDHQAVDSAVKARKLPKQG